VHPHDHPGTRRRELECAWVGEVTWRQTASLREVLFDHLDHPRCAGVRLDVQKVTGIDRVGVALLIGANRRAARAGRRLQLIDSSGPVTNTLARMRLLHHFLVTRPTGPSSAETLA